MIETSSPSKFESSVNSEGIETPTYSTSLTYTFESSVNSEGIETVAREIFTGHSLRAV